MKLVGSVERKGVKGLLSPVHTLDFAVMIIIVQKKSVLKLHISVSDIPCKENLFRNYPFKTTTFERIKLKSFLSFAWLYDAMDNL